MKISIHTQPLVMQYGTKQTYKWIREAGFEAVDWALEQAWNSRVVLASNVYKDLSIFEKEPEEIMAHYAQELSHIRANGLTITQAHAPDPPFGGPNGYAHLEYAISIYRKMIPFCHEIGCKKLVIHAHSVPCNGTMSPEECKRVNLYLYESLIPVLVKTDVTVCVENLWFPSYMNNSFDIYDGVLSDPWEARELIDTLNQKAGKECFGICLDTGHLHLVRIFMEEYIPIVGNRIKALHIHDNMQNYDSHVLPYGGSIRWKDFIQQIKAIGYTGDLNFETTGQYGSFIPTELIPMFLNVNAEIGKYFRRQIESK